MRSPCLSLFNWTFQAATAFNRCDAVSPGGTVIRIPPTGLRVPGQRSPFTVCVVELNFENIHMQLSPTLSGKLRQRYKGPMGIAIAPYLVLRATILGAWPTYVTDHSVWHIDAGIGSLLSCARVCLQYLKYSKASIYGDHMLRSYVNIKILLRNYVYEPRWILINKTINQLGYDK